jgi:phosphoserine phosphatase
MDDALVSWKDGPAKQAVVGFVTSSTQDGPGFVAPADRIATFDNDGTLWVEQPMPPQFDFVFRKWADEAQKDPSLAREQPYKAIIEKDPAFFEGIATQEPEVVATLLKAFARSWSGTTPDEFEAQVRVWLTDVDQANDFRVFVCSGGGREFMRVFAEETWGIFRENVIGSAAGYEYKDGRIVRTDQVLGGLALGPGKPEHIFAQTGRMPLFAGGNADVDIEMLTVARFALLVDHDDEEREYAYTKGAEKSLTKAKDLGWTVVSMKNDWTTVF